MRIRFDWFTPNTVKKFLLVISISLLPGAGCSLQETKATDSAQQQNQTVGWIEKGKIAGVEKEVKVKLDTGATTTSINADILEQPGKETESGGMIKFRFSDGDGVKQTFELPIVRWVRIESRQSDYIRRPVVRMKLCVAGQWIEEEVNLADRDDFNYPVLIGRNMLEKGKLVVDSSQTFTKDPSCPAQEAQQ
ncbi:ATP-dependent zinc protease [Nostocaceae cyanobacterium CENA357]|uniref:ATP-dependent zinc protease n=1 Tax=Atlanticothrix silvestris CENA357 TaxID=1725252 RepID=A0A8J7HEP3_9CYAN|nr:RimK/LysX family protein [Atlanticothrix silvestris]MBH8553604.1 ATP-dependent zinc protease [Atlanticothrix silvestris CENA357]